MGRKRHKPSTPEEIAARKREREEAQVEKIRLEAQGVTVTLDGSSGKIRRAQRVNVFDLLLSRKALSTEAFDAFRAHEEAVHIAAGWATPERRPDHIRATCEGAPGQNITQPMIDASRLVEMTMTRLSPKDAALLDALMALGAGNLARWRRTVQTATGETNDHAQAARVRALGDNLADARIGAVKAFKVWREKRLRPANDEHDAPLTEYANSATKAHRT